ncbi:hypothetical protein [Adlercreutzia muris]|jgi:uncharacterized membrane protein YqjE|uniref:hypothetical protein n=1 Tax=Adlercreutzia muris TaxID=1796610 RepID=UPI0014794444|nr:hypothetical protein [Adlercreutzia muris]MCR2027457.1 SPP1 phage holin family protein [Adlercreutzia muris]
MEETNDAEPMVEQEKVDEERLFGILRLVFPLVLIVLVALIATGVVDADRLAAAVTSVLAIIGLVVAWWKDNNMTLMAIIRHAVWKEEK